MAAPTKENCQNCFYSQILPQETTINKLSSSDNKTRYKAYRNIASQYIRKQEVKEYFFNKMPKCVCCGSDKNLQIDHIIDAYTCAKELIDYRCMNCEKNLRVLCEHCNVGITPGKNQDIGLFKCMERW